MTTWQLCVPFALCLVMAGCGYDDDDSDHRADEDRRPAASATAEIVRSTIDTDATLEDIFPGEGVGVYIDAASDGSWGVYTSCDTARSGEWCEWDIIASPLPGALSYEPDGVELADMVIWSGNDDVRMLADTGYDLDGFVLYTDPGAAVRFDILLDGEVGRRYVYWVGDGALHAGAPTNPIELEPIE